MIKALLKILLILFSILAVAVIVFGIYKFINRGPVGIDWTRGGTLTALPDIFSLDITSPDNQTIVFNQSVEISGKTSPRALVIISVEDTDVAISADQNGNFSKTVGLTSGLNHITITSFDSKGNSKADSREIYYSGEQL